MFNNCFNLQSHDRKGVVTKIDYQVSKTCKSCRSRARKNNKIMQNKANFKNNQINTSTCNRSGYGNYLFLFRLKNKAKQSQFKPNFSPKLASFSPNLALFDKEIIAFWYGLRSKFGRVERIEQACLQRTLRREQKNIVDDLPKSIICVNLCESVSKNISVESVKSVANNNFILYVLRVRLWRDLAFWRELCGEISVSLSICSLKFEYEFIY